MNSLVYMYLNFVLSLSHSAPGDYHQMTSTAVEFTAGETEQTVVIPIVDDRVLEEIESFSIEISSTSNGVVVEDGRASVVIEDDDGNGYNIGTATLHAISGMFNVHILGHFIYNMVSGYISLQWSQ